jgi:hypothetical protein
MVDEDIPTEERVSFLEKELEGVMKEIKRMTETLFGTIAILCLPLSKGKRIEYGFKQLRLLPNDILVLIIKTYLEESKNSDLTFAEAVSPIINMLGFERAWKILPASTIKGIYGDWAVHEWEEMAEKHSCEE